MNKYRISADPMACIRFVQRVKTIKPAARASPLQAGQRARPARHTWRWALGLGYSAIRARSRTDKLPS